MTDQVHTNETSRGFFAGIVNVLGLIAGPKGFFGPGFFKDFKEGYDKARQPGQSFIADNGDASFDNTGVESMWDDQGLSNQLRGMGVPYSQALEGQFKYTMHPACQDPDY